MPAAGKCRRPSRYSWVRYRNSKAARRLKRHPRPGPQFGLALTLTKGPSRKWNHPNMPNTAALETACALVCTASFFIALRM